MNNNSPRGQPSQNLGSTNNERAVHRPAGHGVMYHNNGMPVQTPNYVQPQAPQDSVQRSQPPMPPPYPPPFIPYGGPQPSQAGPPPGLYGQNNPMAAYGPVPFNNPVIPPYPAAASHHAANVWYQAPQGGSPMHSVGSNNMMYQPYNGPAVPNNGMHFPNNVTGWTGDPSHNIPTSQAPSTVGVPAFNYDFVNSQHGTVQYDHVQRGQVQRGQAQRGQAQQRHVRRRRVQHGTGQHASGSNIYGPSQPSAGPPSVNTPAAPSHPTQAPVQPQIDAITAEFLRTVDPRGFPFGPGDMVDPVWLAWYLGQLQQGQAMVQHPGPAGHPAGTPGGHVPDGSMPTNVPFTEEEINHYLALSRAWFSQAPES